MPPPPLPPSENNTLHVNLGTVLWFVIWLLHHFTLQGKENMQNMQVYYTVDCCITP